MRFPFILTVMMIAVWLLLSRGESTSWVIGVPFLTLAGFVFVVYLGTGEHQQSPKFRIRPVGTMQFIVFFIVESLRGGIDVVRIVLSAKPVLNPQFFDYPVSLKNSVAQQLFISSISLLPGTLSVDWEDGNVRIHVLNLQDGTFNGVKALEIKIANIHGEALC